MQPRQKKTILISVVWFRLRVSSRSGVSVTLGRYADSADTLLSYTRGGSGRVGT